MGILDDIRRHYRQGGILLRIIYINVGMFLLLHAVALVAWLMGSQAPQALLWVEVPSRWQVLLTRPWTLLTYCFAHYDVLHILFNMLWLYWMGRIFLEFFTPKHLAGLYVLGGIGGALLYVAAYTLLPPLANENSYLLGASASVLAIVVALAVYTPDYRIGLLFLGQVALKWVAVVCVLLSVLGIGASNTGGNIAHIGGALVGLWFALAIRRGRDITAWLNRSIDWLAGLLRREGRPGRPSVGAPVGGTAWRPGNRTARHTATNEPTEADLDRVLEKISRSGYASLTDSERDILFRASRRR
ncbi:MAG: rhomboid family intramembrane serine protease [Muribaculaceae bacterium]|nr:rhomboid family intramembrane serine protease [Muribaculaceae bacterium]